MLAALLALFFCPGCEEGSDRVVPKVRPREVLTPKVPLSETFLTRGNLALQKYLQGQQLLEFRADPERISAQIQAGPSVESLVQVDYTEQAGPPGQPPIGQVHGPTPVPIRGGGNFKENLFPYDELHLTAIGHKFRIAKMAVDPLDGRVEKLIVRRNLPFGSRVRGRIYVASPRLPGSIDVNEKGSVLKR